MRRTFRQGDVVELHLPVAPRYTAADPRIDAVRGCLAVERGPEVFCLESIDLAAATHGRIDDISAVRLDPAQPPREVADRVVVRLRHDSTTPQPWPYDPAPNLFVEGEDEIAVAMLPYHEWAERGPSTMRVWLPAAQ